MTAKKKKKGGNPNNNREIKKLWNIYMLQYYQH